MAMDIDWKLLLMALGLAFVLEGLPYFLFAERMGPMLKLISERPPSALRILGLMAIGAGLLVILAVRSLGGTG